MQPFKTKFTPYFKMQPKFGKAFPKAEYPNREKKPVHTFDIREFVKAKKQEKINKMMEEGGMPGGGMGMM